MADTGFKTVFTDLRLNLAFGFGSGLSPIVPGTMGTAVSILPFLAMAHLNLWVYLSITLLSVIVGIYLCGYACEKLGVHDHKGIVWDEFSGFWITMFAVPVMDNGTINWVLLGIGFVLFRFFDMVKPWPISWADKKVDGGVGVMLDDVLAGIAGCLVLHGLLYFKWV